MASLNLAGGVALLPSAHALGTRWPSRAFPDRDTIPVGGRVLRGLLNASRKPFVGKVALLSIPLEERNHAR
jgi:hypothetical protein